MENMATNTNINQEILATILLDMASSGVTDIVSETSFDMFADIIIKKPIIQPKPAPQPVIPVTKPQVQEVKPVQKTPETNLENNVWILNENAQIICISTGLKNGTEPFTGDEQILFNNMLKAIGLSAENIGYIVVNKAVCNEDNQEQLTQICRRLVSSSKAQVIISFGENMCPILMGGNVSLSGVRGFGKEVSGVRYVATYSPISLLKQPLLKRLAWEDLQIAQGYMKVVADA